MKATWPLRAVFHWLFAVLVASAPAQENKKKESEPPAKSEAANGLTAVLFGKEITAKTNDELSGAIVGALFQRYAKDNDIRVTDADLDAFAAASARRLAENIKEWERDKAALEKELRAKKLTASERREKEKKLAMYTGLLESERESEEFRKRNPVEGRESTRRVAEHFVLAWKLNASLFKKYGGRVIFQQAGPEPLDAYRRLLEEREKAGDFKISDEETRKKFWEYFVNDQMHTFLSDADGRKAMTTPFWLLDEAGDK